MARRKLGERPGGLSKGRRSCRKLQNGLVGLLAVALSASGGVSQARINGTQTNQAAQPAIPFPKVFTGYLTDVEHQSPWSSFDEQFGAYTATLRLTDLSFGPAPKARTPC